MAMFDEFYKEQQAIWDAMEKKDAEAKARDEIIGRYFYVLAFDGRAYYQVARIVDQMAVLDLVPYMDAYADETIEMMERTIPLTVVKQKLAQMDLLDKLFGEQDERNTLDKT